jgi:release factor glutamine methyltransferase
MSLPDLEGDLLARLDKEVDLLPDKPEENAETTLVALWWTAAGHPCSIEKAMGRGPKPELTAEQRSVLESLVQKRIDGVPLAHLTGRQEFLGIDLLTSPAALIPRKETEILGNAALDLMGEMESERGTVTLLDVCTGSGNLALAMTARQSRCRTFGADISEVAIQLARENARFLGLEDRVEFLVGDLMEPFRDRLGGLVDLLTCNPPYISTAKVDTMPGEISSHEPAEAFDGGTFGVAILMRLIREAPLLLCPGGWLAFELGLGQGLAMLKRLEKSADYSAIRSFENEAGEIRALAARRV